LDDQPRIHGGNRGDGQPDSGPPGGDDRTLGQSPLTRPLNLDTRGDSLVAVIAEWVGRNIIEGRLRPGDDLNSVELARHFSCSRTPVREALMLLEKEGLVEIPARRRPRVASIRIEQVREIYRLRAALMAETAHLVIQIASDAEIGELRQVYNAMRARADVGDLDGYFWANVDFQTRTVELTRDSTLARIINSLGLRVLQLRHFSMSLQSRMAQSADDHGRIIRAYEERDPELAAALHRSVIKSALKAIEQSGWDGE
jgi:DNA-binding GntR family transcriptional regulator